MYMSKNASDNLLWGVFIFSFFRQWFVANYREAMLDNLLDNLGVFIFHILLVSYFPNFILSYFIFSYFTFSYLYFPSSLPLVANGLLPSLERPSLALPLFMINFKNKDKTIIKIKIKQWLRYRKGWYQF